MVRYLTLNLGGLGSDPRLVEQQSWIKCSINKIRRCPGGWRKLYNEELHNLYSSPSIIRIIKSRRMRWAGHVVRMGEKRIAYRILMGNS
jgi:hypothetical protein